MSSGLTSSFFASETTALSALLQTDRARWRLAESAVPPGRMKLVSRGSFVWRRSIISSSFFVS
jgi:hypothetical protein